MWLQKLVACFDAEGLRGTQAEWEHWYGESSRINEIEDDD